MSAMPAFRQATRTLQRRAPAGASSMMARSMASETMLMAARSQKAAKMQRELIADDEFSIKNFTLNFGPQHPAAHGVLRLVSVSQL